MFRRSIFISLALLAFGAGIFATVREFQTAARYNVILLTVESTRLDAFSRENTPKLWQAAQQGTRFTRHRTASAWTGANIISILTGLSAFRHGVHSRDTTLPADRDLPLKRLAAAGWRVEGVQPFMLIDGFRNLGLDIAPGSSPTAWLATQATARQPFLLWYHYLETHLPYEPAAEVAPPDDAETAARMAVVQKDPAIPAASISFLPEDRIWIEQLYHAQFQVFDNWFGEFWQFLNNSGLLDTTILVLTTDHGEELLERGAVGHASTTRTGHLHEEISRVPLIVWLPPSLQATKQPATIEAPSSHLDIMPTIVERLQPNFPMAFEGQDLFSLPAGRAWQGVTSRAGFAEHDPDRIAHFIAARVEDNWKLHAEFSVPARFEHISLYDLSTDPDEKQDLADREPARAKRMTQSLLPEILALRIARPNRSMPPGISATAPPEWVFPKQSATVSFDELPSPLTLRWKGTEDADYRLQYRAGEGAFAIEGELAVNGLAHDFGPLDRDYWNRYIVPYKIFHLRLGPAGRDDAWGPWLTIRVGE